MRAQALLALLLSVTAGAASGQATAPGATVVESGPGWGVATTTTMASARIVAVDAAARRLDVELADGRLVGLVVPPDIRRLAELRAGDVVNVAFVDALILELRKDGKGLVARSELSEVRRGPSGAPPSGVAQSETSVLADVVAVDTASGTITLRGPERTVQLRIRDARQLALVKPGDQVQATFSEAVAVSVDPAR